jgi:hypothetical protein
LRYRVSSIPLSHLISPSTWETSPGNGFWDSQSFQIEIEWNPKGIDMPFSLLGMMMGKRVFKKKEEQQMKRKRK